MQIASGGTTLQKLSIAWNRGSNCAILRKHQVFTILPHSELIFRNPPEQQIIRQWLSLIMGHNACDTISKGKWRHPTDRPFNNNSAKSAEKFKCTDHAFSHQKFSDISRGRLWSSNSLHKKSTICTTFTIDPECLLLEYTGVLTDQLRANQVQDFVWG